MDASPTRRPTGSQDLSFSAYVKEELTLPPQWKEAMEQVVAHDVIYTSWEPEEDDEALPANMRPVTSARLAAARQRPRRYIGSQAQAPTHIAQGFAAAKGPSKPSMQDRHVAVNDPSGSMLWSMAPPEMAAVLQRRSASPAPFAVTAIYDGHGAGEHSAHTAADSTLHAIAGHADVLAALTAEAMGDDGALPQNRVPLSDERAAAVSSGFRAAFHHLDERICREGVQRNLPVDGATALVSLQMGAVLYTANAGDSRAVLCRDGDAVRLSRDHAPALSVEKRRIEAAGGRVMNVRGHWRVVLPLPNGTSAKICAVSRGFGDRDFKERQLISAEPDMSALLLQPGRDTFTIHASDGLWVTVSDQEAVASVNKTMAELAPTLRAADKQAAAQRVAAVAAHNLLALAVRKGSMDDISIVINLFTWAS